MHQLRLLHCQLTQKGAELLSIDRGEGLQKLDLHAGQGEVHPLVADMGRVGIHRITPRVDGWQHVLDALPAYLREQRPKAEIEASDDCYSTAGADQQTAQRSTTGAERGVSSSKNQNECARSADEHWRHGLAPGSGAVGAVAGALQCRLCAGGRLGEEELVKCQNLGVPRVVLAVFDPKDRVVGDAGIFSDTREVAEPTLQLGNNLF